MAEDGDPQRLAGLRRQPADGADGDRTEIRPRSDWNRSRRATTWPASWRTLFDLELLETAMQRVRLARPPTPGWPSR